MDELGRVFHSILDVKLFEQIVKILMGKVEGWKRVVDEKNRYFYV
jgi:hypothetical protein